jgi:hypothetical protein
MHLWCEQLIWLDPRRLPRHAVVVVLALAVGRGVLRPRRRRRRLLLLLLLLLLLMVTGGEGDACVVQRVRVGSGK